MLVLGRRVGESLIIDGNIRVTILGIEGERIRVGVEAPRSVPVVRQELYEAIEAENRQAAARGVDAGLLRQLGQALGAPAE